jgi:hypothetical protein
MSSEPLTACKTWTSTTHKYLYDGKGKVVNI